MTRFDHPSIVNGTISFEDQEFEVKDGVVECPMSIGRGADWPISHKLVVEVAPVDPPVDAPGPGDVLKGSVPDVVAFVKTITSPDELHALEQLEIDGKNRKGVIEAIDNRYGELEASSSSS